MKLKTPTLWLTSLTAQGECLPCWDKKCGKGIFACIVVENHECIPCRQPTCPWEIELLNLGPMEVFGETEIVAMRKLKVQNGVNL